MKLKNNYRITIQVFKEGEISGMGRRFKTELIEDQDELNECIANFTEETIYQLEEEYGDED